MIQITIIFLGIVLNIACYKYRWLADCIVYIHMLIALNNLLIPAVKTNLTEIYVAMVCMLELLLFGTGQVGQLIYIACAQLILTFGIKCTIYEERLSIHLFIIKLIMVAGTIVINALLSMIVLYI